ERQVVALEVGGSSPLGHPTGRRPRLGAGRRFHQSSRSVMSVSVREAGPFERLIEFELTEAEIDAAKTAAARRLAKDLKPKGFRPGRGPRPVVGAGGGKERLRSEAIEAAIPPKLSEVLREESLRPAVTPEWRRSRTSKAGCRSRSR